MKTANGIASVIIIIVAAICLFHREAYTADKIAYINLQAIMEESDMGKTANADYNRMQGNMDGEIKEKMQELEALNAQLQSERKKDPVDAKKLASIMEKLQHKNKEYERLAVDMKEDLAKKDRELVTNVFEKVAPILTDIAKSRGYAVIFKNAADLAYIASEVDITKEVIEKLNKEKAGR